MISFLRLTENTSLSTYLLEVEIYLVDLGKWITNVNTLDKKRFHFLEAAEFTKRAPWNREECSLFLSSLFSPRKFVYT